MNVANTRVIALGLMLALGLFATPPCAVGCAAVPEPSAIPELVLSLAVTGISVFFWRRRRKSV